MAGLVPRHPVLRSPAQEWTTSGITAKALIVAGCQPATVAIQLTLVRFYDAAIRAGLHLDSPAAGVRLEKTSRERLRLSQ